MSLRPTDSLAVRVIGLSSLWAVAAFIVVGGLLYNLYEGTAIYGFKAVVRTQLFILVASVTVNEDGYLSGSPDLGDVHYSQPLSGWYWEVIPASANTKGRLASFSLASGEIAAPPQQSVPFDGQYRRDYRAQGLGDERVYVEEGEVVLDAENHTARFRVMANASFLEEDLARFYRRLRLYLGLFGLGSILINALAILIGLHPLIGVRRALGEIRAGRVERLPANFPAEIRPLATEMNGLIDNNRRIVDRARTQVGNLAHSLKTPIAVLMNEANVIGGDRGRLVAEQSEIMRRQVQHYLDRAQVAALSEGSLVRTPVGPVLERLVRVIRTLNPSLEIDLSAQEGAPQPVFAGERQDLEEIVGNLMENAAKWAATRVVVSVAPQAADRLSVRVEDDGPGLADAEIADALQRGKRLDEQKPGSGLGLSIVSETVLDYRGEFQLSRSALGGLKAEVILPQAPAEAR